MVGAKRLGILAAYSKILFNRCVKVLTLFQTTYLQLFQGESLAGTDASVVPECRATNNRLQ